ncbi:hypothetical protein [Nocardia carnea]|uniref:Uncharacterized protein n=1 Tax=Nocardia carnea TaxID=37328 RepID=A0ABW7TSF3_9NOCA|nr:hypothetical protein [Nocardia carnea]
MTNPREEPMLDLARGDIGMSRHLKSALNVLADSGLAQGMEKQLREIAQGNGSVRDLRHNEAFLRLSDSLLAQAERDQADQDREEQQRLVEEGNAVLDGYRQHDPNPLVPAPHSATPNPPTSAAPTPAPLNPSPGPSHPGPAPGATTENHPATPAPPARNRRQSWRDVVVTPDEPDEDDAYFQERRQRGWLQ